MRRFFAMCGAFSLWVQIAALLFFCFAVAAQADEVPDSPLKDKINRERPMCFRQQVITDWLVYPDGRKRKIASIVMTVPCERQ